MRTARSVKNERGGRNGGPVQLFPTESCPDCALREGVVTGPTLDIVGMPRRHRWYGFKLSLDCSTCEGSGRVPRS